MTSPDPQAIAEQQQAVLAAMQQTQEPTADSLSLPEGYQIQSQGTATGEQLTFALSRLKSGLNEDGSIHQGLGAFSTEDDAIKVAVLDSSTRAEEG